MPVRFECISPILRVNDLRASLDYYVRVLGFTKAEWVKDDATFGMVQRDGCCVYLCENDQGQPGTWFWIGVDGDVDALYRQFKEKGASFREEPTNYSWAYEFRVQDPDGHVIRFGGEPKANMPFKQVY
jgi:predicted lactoylglutathione lyase